MRKSVKGHVFTGWNSQRGNRVLPALAAGSRRVHFLAHRAKTEEGDFTWSFDKAENSGKLHGEFGIYDSNLLVLISEDSQMVGEVSFAEDSKLSFVLAGGPRGDPGLDFVRQP